MHANQSITHQLNQTHHPTPDPIPYHPHVHTRTGVHRLRQHLTYTNSPSHATHVHPRIQQGFIDCDNISARCMLTIFQLFAVRSEASVLRMCEVRPRPPC